MEASPRAVGLVYPRIYALCMAGRIEEAEALSQTAEVTGTTLPYWQLLSREFGLPVPGAG